MVNLFPILKNFQHFNDVKFRNVFFISIFNLRHILNLFIFNVIFVRTLNILRNIELRFCELVLHFISILWFGCSILTNFLLLLFEERLNNGNYNSL